MPNTAGPSAADQVAVAEAKAANEGITLDADSNPKEPIDACDGSIYTLRILPFQYYLRGGFHPEYGGTTPEGVHKPKPYKGKWFENPNLVEGLEREVVIDPEMDLVDLSDALMLLLSDKHGYGCEFTPDGLYKEQSPGPGVWPLQKRVIGLYAEKHVHTKKPGEEAGKREDIFVPLQAILKRPDYYCDRSRFPRFYDHSPNILNLKAVTKDGFKRADDKEKDYGDGFKRYVSEVRAELKLYIGLLVLMHIVLTVVWNFMGATLTTPVVAFLLRSRWAKRSKFLKAHYTQWWPNHREYWRWIKDDNLARMIAYFFPCTVLQNGAVVIPGLNYLLRDELQPKGKQGFTENRLPPDVTQEDKDKSRDTSLQTFVFWILGFYTVYYTPLVGWILQVALMGTTYVLPLVVKIVRFIPTFDDIVAWFERFGIVAYKDSVMEAVLFHGPAQFRAAAQVAIRKVMYRELWVKNMAQVDLPTRGSPVYDHVMQELYKICQDEFGFEHNEERVCKAMFERTEMKHVQNVEHFTFVFVMVMMPILLLTPKEFRTARFFLAVPFIFTLCLIFIPQDVINNVVALLDFGPQLGDHTLNTTAGQHSFSSGKTF